MIRAKVRAVVGAKKKGSASAISGVVCCLAKSLSASAKGCGRPEIPTLFGPFRSWK